MKAFDGRILRAIDNAGVGYEDAPRHYRMEEWPAGLTTELMARLHVAFLNEGIKVGADRVEARFDGERRWLEFTRGSTLYGFRLGYTPERPFAEVSLFPPEGRRVYITYAFNGRTMFDYYRELIDKKGAAFADSRFDVLERNAGIAAPLLSLANGNAFFPDTARRTGMVPIPLKILKPTRFDVDK